MMPSIADALDETLRFQEQLFSNHDGTDSVGPAGIECEVHDRFDQFILLETSGRHNSDEIATDRDGSAHERSHS